MKRKLSALSQRYATALKKHLRQRSPTDVETARGLGREAVAIGLETLDIARIHERALAALEVGSSTGGLIERANIFFTEVIKSLGKTPLAALKAGTRLNRLNQTLGRRTEVLTASNRCLKEGIARGRTVEAGLKKRVEQYKKLLKESLPLQKHLQRLTRRILTAQENSRRKISHELRDDIAQTLLGINVRLLTVKMAACHHDKRLQKEIASTQLLVEESVRSINRFAHELDLHQQANFPILRGVPHQNLKAKSKPEGRQAGRPLKARCQPELCQHG